MAAAWARSPPRAATALPACASASPNSTVGSNCTARPLAACACAPASPTPPRSPNDETAFPPCPAHPARRRPCGGAHGLPPAARGRRCRGRRRGRLRRGCRAGLRSAAARSAADGRVDAGHRRPWRARTRARPPPRGARADAVGARRCADPRARAACRRGRLPVQARPSGRAAARGGHGRARPALHRPGDRAGPRARAVLPAAATPSPRSPRRSSPSSCSSRAGAAWRRSPKATA